MAAAPADDPDLKPEVDSSPDVAEPSKESDNNDAAADEEVGAEEPPEAEPVDGGASAINEGENNPKDLDEVSQGPEQIGKM